MKAPQIAGLSHFKTDAIPFLSLFSMHALNNSPDRIKPSIMTILSKNE
jgi:hypothetical protein